MERHNRESARVESRAVNQIVPLQPILQQNPEPASPIIRPVGQILVADDSAMNIQVAKSLFEKLKLDD